MPAGRRGALPVPLVTMSRFRIVVLSGWQPGRRYPGLSHLHKLLSSTRFAGRQMVGKFFVLHYMYGYYRSVESGGVKLTSDIQCDSKSGNLGSKCQVMATD